MITNIIYLLKITTIHDFGEKFDCKLFFDDSNKNQSSAKLGFLNQNFSNEFVLKILINNSEFR